MIIVKKIWLILFGLAAVALLCIRFLVIDIIRTDAAGDCPNKAGFVLVNRWNPNYRSNEWVTYHQPAITRGETEDKGALHLGKVMAAPGDTLWYNNEDGLIDNKQSARFSHPIAVPCRGKRLEITDDNIRFYAITIMLHEPSKVCIIGDSLCVSGKMVDSYAFSQDYYWIHNDDTIHQPDSRSFGFIPHKSLIGRIIDVTRLLEK